jgi:Riboflavin synthase alpha chain
VLDRKAEGLAAGAKVNLEVDLYVERMLAAGKEIQRSA